MERAQDEAVDLAELLATQVKAPADSETAAKANGLTVLESEPFAPGEPITGLGAAPEVSARVFAMNEGEVSDVLPTPRGFVLATLAGREDAYVPKLEEVKERVRDTLIKQKAAEASEKRAIGLAAKLKSAADFDAAAKASGFQRRGSSAHYTRLSGSPARNSAGDHRRRVQTASGSRQRSDFDRHRNGHRQGARKG